MGVSDKKYFVSERFFSDVESNPSVGLANIQASVPDIEANKDNILRAVEIFREKKAGIAVFPEFSLSGYFWGDETACRRYMDKAVIENHIDWIEKSLKPLLNDDLGAVILNNLERGPGGRYLNSTFIVSRKHDYLKPENKYTKTFLPTLEKVYSDSGKDDRLVMDTRFGRFGFTTCYDFMFSQLLLEYSALDNVDAVIQLASWRAMARREYPRMNVKTDIYYGYLWDLMMASTAASHQIWVIACNAVGRHGVSGAEFWGGSGIWAPSGLPLVQASRTSEELLIAHNLDIQAHREFEKDDFNYALDFSSIYRPVKGERSFTRIDV